MSTTEEQRLVEAAVAARESETAGWPGSVDDVVAGGRRRVRRRRAAVLVPALGLTLVAGGLAATLTGGRGEVQPAPPVSTSASASSTPTTSPTASTTTSPTASATSTPFAGWDGCTLRPETCDGTVVAGWFADHVAALRATGDLAFEDAASTSSLEGFPAGTRWFTTAHMESIVDTDQPIDQIVFPPQVDVYVTARGSGNYFWKPRPASDPAPAEKKVRSVEVRPGLEARVVDGQGQDTWAVPEGEGHGAVYVLVQEKPGSDGRVFTDDAVVDLLRLLLEDPEVTGG
ncbi:hypothetical protein [Janibacter sp. G368]|jgi:hypothetical protein|uniref:hypothetical protein n=1 Tax=Janibacter sp. G368 TaxID=3420441 RepID=UPI003CFE8B6F